MRQLRLHHGVLVMARPAPLPDRPLVVRVADPARRPGLSELLGVGRRDLEAALALHRGAILRGEPACRTAEALAGILASQGIALRRRPGDRALRRALADWAFRTLLTRPGLSWD